MLKAEDLGNYYRVTIDDRNQLSRLCFFCEILDYEIKYNSTTQLC